MLVKRSSKFLGIDSDHHLIGWAYHSLKTETVEIFIDDLKIGSTKANQILDSWSDRDSTDVPMEAMNKFFRFKLPAFHVDSGDRKLDIKLGSGDSIDGLPLVQPLTAGAPETQTSGIIQSIQADGKIQGWVAEANKSWSRPWCKLLFETGEEMCFQAGSFQDKPTKVNDVEGFEFRLRVPSHLCRGEQISTALLVETSQGWTILDKKSAYIAPKKSTPQNHLFRRNHRYVVIDPSLKQKKGHVLGVVERLEKHCRSRGISLTVYANKEFPDSKIGQTEVVRIFNRSMYDIVDQKGLGSAIANLNTISSSLKNDLEAIYKQQGSLENVILLYPTVNHFMFKALGSTLRSKAFDNNEFHCINLMLETGIAQKDGQFIVEDQMQASVWQSGFQDLSKIKKHVTVGAMSETLRLAAQQLSEQHVASFPPFLGIDPHVQRPKQSDKKRIGLYLGEIKTDKGFYNLPDVIRQLDKKYKNLEIVVQTVINSKSPRHERTAVEAIKDLAATCQNDIQIIDSFVDADDYAEMLLACDMIVIGYDPKRYAAKTSGIFWEAQSAGIPVVVPNNTWLSQEAQESGLQHVGFDEQSVTDLLKALTAMISQINKRGLTKLRRDRPARQDLTTRFLTDIECRFYNQGNKTRISEKIGQKGLVELQTDLCFDAQSAGIPYSGADVVSLADSQKAFLVRDEFCWDLVLDQSYPLAVTVTGSSTNRPTKLKNLKLLVNGEPVSGKFLVLNKTYWRYTAHLPEQSTQHQNSGHAEPLRFCLSFVSSQQNSSDKSGVIVQQIDLQAADLPKPTHAKKIGALK